MSIIALAVNLGNPDSAGIFPLAATSVATGIGQAQTDLTTLGNNILTAAVDAGTADTQAATVTSDMTTVIADGDAALGTGTNGFAGLVGLTYNGATHQITGTASVSQTLTAVQINALAVLLNTLMTAILQANTDAVTLKADTLSTKTAVNGLSSGVTAVQADLTLATSGIAGANVYIQSDSTIVTNVSQMNAALAAALTFVRDAAILPT